MEQQTNQTTQQQQQQTSTLQTLIKKVSSRKFIMAFIGVVTGILGLIGCNDNVIAVVAFATLEVLSIGIYCIMEGRVDATSANNAVTVAKEVIDLIEQLKQQPADGSGKVELPEGVNGEYLDMLDQKNDTNKQ